jgi:hypothetical protein
MCNVSLQRTNKCQHQNAKVKIIRWNEKLVEIKNLETPTVGVWDSFQVICYQVLLWFYYIG